MTDNHKQPARTALCRYTPEAIYYREDNLVEDLIGKVSFVDVFMRQTFGRQPSDAERHILDAVLVTLMEHGMTPSVIATRMVYSSSPENIQAGVAAGLLAVGSRFVGTMEEAAHLLNEIVAAAEDGPEKAARIARDFRLRSAHVPGFGHHLHRPDDPRASALLQLARDLGTAGVHSHALGLLAAEVDNAAGRHITVNATGAVAAVLGDIGIPASLMRGIAVLSRAAGLIAHIAEEQQQPTGRYVWDMVDASLGANVAARTK